MDIQTVVGTMTQGQALSLVKEITSIRLRAGKLGCRDVAKALDAAAYLAGRALADELIAERRVGGDGEQGRTS